MYRVDNPTGRLVTCWIHPPQTDEDNQRMAEELRRLIAVIKGRAVVVSDLRSAALFSPESSARFAALMRSDHTRIERTATLVSAGSPTLSLQIARVAREAGHPGRRTVSSVPEIVDWLAPVLSPDERLALDAFLAAGARGGPGQMAPPSGG